MDLADVPDPDDRHVPAAGRRDRRSRSCRPAHARPVALGVRARRRGSSRCVLLVGLPARRPGVPVRRRDLDWIPFFGIQYKLGADGLSVALVVLTTTLSWISILASFKPIQTRIKEYMVAFLVLEVGMIGVFLALDLFLFYIFWEIVLVPMYLIIGIWGGANRIYATIKFVLYTLVGSLLMLVAILATAFAYQAAHGGIVGGRLRLRDAAGLRDHRAAVRRRPPARRVPRVLPGLRDQGPDVPVPHLAAGRPHRGPDRGLGDPGRDHAEARRLRVHPVRVPLFPDAAQTFAPAIIVLSLIAIIYGAIVALVQPDLKRLVAYSSVSHMGFVTLGLFVFTEQGVQGAILQMINHGLITGALFLLVGVIYERTHDRTIAKMGGLAAKMPVYVAVFGFFVFASAACPACPGSSGSSWRWSGRSR